MRIFRLSRIASNIRRPTFAGGEREKRTKSRRGVDELGFISAEVASQANKPRYFLWAQQMLAPKGRFNSAHWNCMFNYKATRTNSRIHFSLCLFICWQLVSFECFSLAYIVNFMWHVFVAAWPFRHLAGTGAVGDATANTQRADGTKQGWRWERWGDGGGG